MSKLNYVQVNNIRFVSMIAIIVVHSIFFSFTLGKNIDTADFNNIIISDFFKFGTISFFMISGYLLGSKKTEYSDVIFLLRRVKTVAKPWLFWSIILTFATITHSISTQKNWLIINVLHKVYLNSEYWFVLNYIIALTTLVISKKISNPATGVIFFIASLFYGINIYLRLIPTIHTTAIFGYIFYLWLGCELRNKENRFINALADLNRLSLIILIIVAFSLSVFESLVIKKYLGTDSSLGIYSNDPVNTLRISNQIYSVFIFIFIFNIKKEIYPTWCNPRNETFGLYLVHWPIMLTLISFIDIIIAKTLNSTRAELVRNSSNADNWIAITLSVLLLFLILYSLSLYFVKMIKTSRFSLIIGKN